MYLKSVVLRGFKSFADRSELKFEPGLTVVVGPNGSGKSNISDAILWVLGEQSAKQLRGQSMEDVIFAGSSARKPVGIAEVDLVLDNSDGVLPVDFHEVVITRRMYRSGESEYLINGSPSRLRDIQDILHDSGLGKDTHSIISQGRLVEILSSRPEDRRVLIEEAAGIAKHKKRKRRAERKLERMQENVKRASAIKREIDRQLKPLELQMNKAKQAQETQSKLKEYKTILAVDDLRQLQKAYGTITERERELSAQEELDRYRLSEKERDLEKLQVMLEQQGLFVGDLAEQRSHMQAVLERLDSGMRLLEEKGNNMVDRLSGLRGTIYQAERRLKERTEESLSINAETASTQAEVSELDAQLDEKNRALEDARISRQKAEDAVRAMQSQVNELSSSRDSVELALMKAKESLSSVTLEDEMYQSRLSELKEKVSDVKELLASREQRLEDNEEILATAEDKSQESEESIKSIRAALAEAKEKRDNTQDKLIIAQSQKRGIEEVIKALESENPLYKSLSQLHIPGFIGTVNQLISAPPELESLVERLLGDDALALVTKNVSDISVQDLSKSAELTGHGSILTTTSQANRRISDDSAQLVGEPLLDKISFAPEAESVIYLLLGDVYLSPSIEKALEALEKGLPGRYVTPQGVVVDGAGRIILGAKSESAQGSLERARELESLNKLIPELTLDLQNHTDEVSAQEHNLESARDKANQIAVKISSLKHEINDLRTAIGRNQKEISQAELEYNKVLQRKDSLLERAQKERDLIDSHTQELDALSEKLNDIEKTRADTFAARSDARDLEREVESEHSEARLLKVRAAERLSHLTSRQKELTAEATSLKRTLETSHETEHTLEVLRSRVEPLHKAYSDIREKALEWAVRLRDQAKLKEADSSSLRETIEEARQATVKAREELEATRERGSKLQVEKAKIDVQVEAAVEAITAPGYMILEEALKLDEPEDRSKLERDILKLEERLSSIGPVNQVALEQYEELSERSSFITEQVEDLKLASSSVAKILRAIDRKMRKQFLDTFAKVDKNFSLIIEQFFPGGQGNLFMEDPDNPENTGIGVFAQPAGKRVRNINALSGGERSLVALALLFAVYRTRTVPFYVLDEVEAALDDANLDRFLDALEQLKESTQLIVVSHQRRTMEQADVLYGVSMQSDGVSQVVSQRLDTLLKEA